VDLDEVWSRFQRLCASRERGDVSEGTFRERFLELVSEYATSQSLPDELLARLESMSVALEMLEKRTRALAEILKVELPPMKRDESWWYDVKPMHIGGAGGE